MNEPRRDLSELQIENYLDGLLSEEDAAECQSLDSERLAQVGTVQQAVDASLSRLFAINTPSVDELLAVLAREELSSPETLLQLDGSPITNVDMLNSATSPPPAAISVDSRRGWLRVVGMMVTVAAVAWLIAAIGNFNKPRIEPYFARRPLTDIYQETVQNGFKPYYYCEDELRFAQTFQKRQHVPLRLAELPGDRHMVGLAYSGGLSRDTTAILCRADEQEVVVFVDVSSEDSEIVSQSTSTSLFVHRREFAGLVAYEVSPFATAKFVDYLEVTTPSSMSL